ncbi:MAG: hypothetical protein IKJ81_03910 [Bacteroidales bacterium]|nr:hypothetical protein [Bacteroidales bacterium]
MDSVATIDLETDVIQRCEFVKDFFDKLNDVVWVLGKFCERADWLMARESRVSQLMSEMNFAATEVEGILKYAEIFDINMSGMLLLANGCELPQDYQSVRKDLQSVLPRILPYCSNELEDMAKLLRASEEENEPTKTINRQMLREATNIIKNFGQVLHLLFFHIEHAYKSFEELNDARIKSLYESQYMRYCNDNVQMLQEYADEIDDVNEAKKELKEMFSLPSLHSIYKRNVGKPHLLIREMRQQCMFENHLMEIFAYRSKMEKLKGMTKTTKETQPQYVVQGDLVMTKHVENEVNGVASGATGVSINKGLAV